MDFGVTKSLPHLPALDSLRGIAILLVMGLHLTPDIPLPLRAAEWLRKIPATGGWIGVDLFFVLSGLLITRILLNAKDDPTSETFMPVALYGYSRSTSSFCSSCSRSCRE